MLSTEETPLLDSSDDEQRGQHPLSVNSSQKDAAKETPIPWRQFSIILFLQLTEPLTSQVIYPFLPELIKDVGITNGDDTKIGYYVGVLQCLFFLTEFLTVFHWSRLSDMIGRKPVILTGLFGISLSMFLFGLSRTFWGLVASRALAGALNGNIGVMKSVVGEITDETNIARTFAYQPLSWTTGVTLGPLIGGYLSRPAERHPRWFGQSEFLRAYPYFLPCAVSASYAVLAWIVTFLFFIESNPTSFSLFRYVKSKVTKALTVIKGGIFGTSHRIALPTGDSLPYNNTAPPIASNEPNIVPLRSVFTSRVLIAAGNYGVLALVDIACRGIQPLFFSAPRSLGGLDFSPPTIGAILAVYGILNGVFQILFFANINKIVGTRTFYLCGVGACFPFIILFPIMSLASEQWGAGLVVWLGIGLQTVLGLFMSSSYACVFIFLTAAAPSKNALGATNGLAQMFVSFMRAVGPAAASSLFSLSLRLDQIGRTSGNWITGGWLVYNVLLLLTSLAFWVGLLLPKEIWKRSEDSIHERRSD